LAGTGAGAITGAATAAGGFASGMHSEFSHTKPEGQGRVTSQPHDFEAARGSASCAAHAAGKNRNSAESWRRKDPNPFRPCIAPPERGHV
jgi:hypothetical protein